MKSMSDSHMVELEQLRARTDRQLFTLIEKRVGEGFALATALSTQDSVENLARAEQSYRFAANFLPTITSISTSEKVWLESRLGELRWRLDGIRDDGVPSEFVAAGA